MVAALAARRVFEVACGHYDIVKNFIDEPGLRGALGRRARNLAYDDLGRSWVATWAVA